MLPSGITSTGFPAIEATAAEMGIHFDPWQRELNRAILAKSASGDYAADTVVMSIGRQVGKTYNVGAVVFADSIVTPGTTTIWTAHRFKVSRETFDELRGLARSPLLAPHIDYDAITTAAGNECIPFRNGSRILFAARERGAIRGFSKVRRLVLDEAQILTEAAMSDMAPTTNHAKNPQVILMGTPPKPTDPCEVFTDLRRSALEGDADGLLYVEFSADPATGLDDRVAWRQANPSFPTRTSAKALLRLRRLLGDENFRREVLGIWDSDKRPSLVGHTRWAELAGQEDTRPSPVAFAVEVSPDRVWTTIALAGWRSDGTRHVQVVDVRKGTDWAPDRLAELAEEWKPVATAINPRGPAGSLIADIDEKATKLHKLTGTELGQACSMMVDAVDAGTVHHPGQTLLTRAASALGKKKTGESWVWRPLDSTDISPFQAATWALFALASKPRNRKPSRVMVMR